jgi:NDP-sugar pyrophosphorylase family protein
MAGHSQRFQSEGYKGCKALLPIGTGLIIDQVVGMFDPRDHFHFVINENQILENPEICTIIRNLAHEVTITIIPPHNYGPTYSALQVLNVKEHEPIIISYCDFTVCWDYKSFLAHMAQADAGVPSFRGFHPASLGDTLFAYMRVDGGRMLELREKKSFTDNRLEEPASAGIYYFSSYKMYKYYANLLLESHDYSKGEAYVSLLLNLMIGDDKEVVVSDVQKFICFGTPSDYRQYLFWENYFNNTQNKKSTLEVSSNQTNLIPMAGKGSRFRNFGYRVAKPLIPVLGKAMVIRAAASLPAANQWIFVARREDVEKHPVEITIKKTYSDAIILSISETTSGQAATCLLAENLYSSQSALLIASCDYEHFYDDVALKELIKNQAIDGIIWTYRMDMNMAHNANAFAYCETENDGVTVMRVVEKKTISNQPSKDPLVIGTFWFRNSTDFTAGARAMIDSGIMINGEHYVGTSINQLINSGKRFVIFDVSQWISFGDPHELKILEYWEEYFCKAEISD